MMGRRCVPTLLAILILAGLGIIAKQAAAQKKTAAANAPQEVYTRPKPDKKIEPTIPSANRFDRNKVFLEYADSLYRLPSLDIEKQILKGSVKFRQAGMWMYCDSAYYYPEFNSLDAFGHVRMEQGDTLFVYSDKLFYDGDQRHARLRCGPSQPVVKLINRDVTLTTDSLDYDLNMELGWYAYGGKIEDKVNVLTSIYGEYSPATKNADFYHDVELVSNRDGFRMVTDTLYYNTDTHIARIVSPTKIMSRNDTILTRAGSYNTLSDNARLTSRSTILHRDSNNNVTTLEGDSIIYDKATRISKAYRFRDPMKHSLPMVITDTARKCILIGGYGLYNDSTRESFATDYPLLMEYSRPDTLFLRADTIKTLVVRHKVFPPLPTVANQQDSVNLSLSSSGDNIVSETITGTSLNDTIVPFENADSILNLQTVRIPLQRDSSEMIEKEFHEAHAYHRARFFNQDLQGIADSIAFHEVDSMMYLFRKPVVWSGERQVAGNRIDVHFNDSVPDWALLPSSGMMAEYIDEDFYNQLAGKKMKAFFEDKHLKRLEVEGNVETIFLPMENDSTYNRLINAESSFLNIDMDGNNMEKLKMWPEVSGTVTPVFLVKNNQKYLQNFRWLESIRPEREWYGDRIKWADNLGEIPEELDEYFRQPPLFPETKSPSPSIMPNPMNRVMDVARQKTEERVDKQIQAQEETEGQAEIEGTGTRDSETVITESLEAEPSESEQVEIIETTEPETRQ